MARYEGQEYVAWSPSMVFILLLSVTSRINYEHRSLAKRRYRMTSWGLAGQVIWSQGRAREKKVFVGNVINCYRILTSVVSGATVTWYSPRREVNSTQERFFDDRVWDMKRYFLTAWPSTFNFFFFSFFLVALFIHWTKARGLSRDGWGGFRWLIRSVRQRGVGIFVETALISACEKQSGRLMSLTATIVLTFWKLAWCWRQTKDSSF